jgi:hypothetical protein
MGLCDPAVVRIERLLSNKQIRLMFIFLGAFFRHIFGRDPVAQLSNSSIVPPNIYKSVKDRLSTYYSVGLSSTSFTN